MTDNKQLAGGEIVTVNEQVEPRPQALTPMGMVSQAVANGASLEMVSKLIDLQERVEKSQGRKAFDIAVAAAKGEIGPIFKDREVDFTSQKGRTNYRHESFAGIASAIGPVLDRNGLSYRFRASQEGGRVSVTCVLAHRDGYSEENTLAAGNDTSGNKNDIQAIGSTTTYLQRYTLKLALGLSTTDKDDDGRGSGSVETISQDQIDELIALIDDVKADRSRFLRFFKADLIADLPASRFGEAVKMLEAKRAA